jgi:transmembrane sensor
MNRVVRLKPQAEVDEEAAAWTWRLDRGVLTPEERSQLASWLRQDARHRRAFGELSQTWRSLDRLSAGKREERIATLAPATRRSDPRDPRGPRSLRWVAAAALSLAVIGSGWWLTRVAGTQEFSTAVGQERTVTLTDGSVLVLNTHTRIEVRFSRARRDIYLLRGEAHFHDTPDPARPFFVHAGEAVVQAIGTRFEVRLHTDRRIDVLVNEGRVEVRTGSGPAQGFGPFPLALGPQRVRALSAGERLSIDGGRMKVVAVSRRRLAADLAWRHGALVFDDEPLAQAAAAVARYTRARIVLEGPVVGRLRISGRFRTNDAPGFFKALATALPVRVIHRPPNRILIEPR